MSDQNPSPQPLPPPGWYPDPSDGSRSRWWDGQRWTDKTSIPGQEWKTRAGGSAPAGRLRPVGDWVSDSFREGFGRFGHLLPLILILLVPLALLNAYLVWRSLYDLALVIDPDQGTFNIEGASENQSLFLGLGLVQFCSLLASYWFFGAVTDQIHRAHRGEPDAWSISFGAAFRRLPRLLGWFLARLLVVVGAAIFVVVTGSFIAALLAPLGLAVIFFAVPVVVIVLWVRLSIIGAVAIVESGNPLARSWRLTAGQFWNLVGRFIVLTLLFGAIWLAASIVASFFTAGSTEPLPAIRPGEPISFSFSALLPASPALYLVGALFGALGSGVRQILLASASLLIHRDLAASEQS